MTFDHKGIEDKWRRQWENDKQYAVSNKSDKEALYVLDMFPYPSGAGLHVGHPKGYIATDVFSRMKTMQGCNVLHPMGWDAFGLPAENYAIKNKVHPRVAVEKNIARYKQQLSQIGFNYDWDREIDTTDPEYYKWTQWIFLQLFKKGLAYESDEPINWCPSCKTGLANEDLESDGTCERCGSVVEQKPLRQWVLQITKYADRMLADLDNLDWPESIKESQRNWIGKSEGARLQFDVLAKSAYTQVLLATNNDAKKARVTKIFKENNIPIEVLSPKDIGIEAIEVVEDGTLRENAIKKARAYADKTDLPILANDTSLFLEGTELDPVTVKRNALDGADETTLTQEEITSKMHSFYEKLARDKGGEVPGYWYEIWSLITPEKEVLVADAKREIVLTSTTKGDIDPYFPIRSLYYSKVTGKYHADATTEDELLELRPVTNALKRLLLPTIEVFTTRPDTLFGATYMVLAPEHGLVHTLEDQITNLAEVKKYIEETKLKNEFERTSENREKTGVELKGVTAVNPATGEEIPVWIADYILLNYGTGAIMAVPAHDERDFEFAKKFDLPIRHVVAKHYSLDGERQEREDVETLNRRFIDAVVHDGNSNFYLLKEKDGSVHLPGGGIEDGESLIDTVRREVIEETGFTDFEINERHTPYINSWAYRIPKQLNQRGFGPAFEVILNSDSRQKSEVEDGDHELIKVSRDELLDKVTWEHHKKFVEWYLSEAETYSGDGRLIHSNEFSGLTTDEAKEKITHLVGGELTSNYRLQDWVFSRQRYWGEPIPIIHCEQCGPVAVPEEELPVTLPDVESYEPTGTGESPLADIPDWVNVPCPKCGGPGKRETNTMPQWAGSSWYYLRYMDPHNDNALVSTDAEKYWAPVDMYVGGAEHATRHLIYARFWHKFLKDIGVVSTEEPFTRLQHVGLIQAEDGRKMSKRWGNVINPDDVIKHVGADTLRVYEMFMGPFDRAIAWSTDGTVGVRRFLERVWRLSEKVGNETGEKAKQELHKTIKKVGEDIEQFRFNTAVSQLMVAAKSCEEHGVSVDDFKIYIQLLAPFAPHLAEELWEQHGETKSVHSSEWPEYDESLLVTTTVTYAVQVNGKVRGTFEGVPDMAEESAEKEARALSGVAKHLEGKTVDKVIFVPGKLVSFVVK